MNAKKFIVGSMTAALICLSNISFSYAYSILLPDPAVPIDGVYLAYSYDCYWSFSNQILASIQQVSASHNSVTPPLLPVATYGNYAASAGTGQLDVVLYSGANGQQNTITKIPNYSATFESSTYDHGGSSVSIDEVWGLGGENHPAPMTVNEVLGFLHASNPYNNIPVFMMDMNQEGGKPQLTMAFQVVLYNTSGVEKMRWTLDGKPAPFMGSNYLWEPGTPVTTTGSILSLPGLPQPPDGQYNEYGPIDHNHGGGKVDFIAYAPTMDLSLYPGDWWFTTEIVLNNLNDGTEEIFLTGGIQVHEVVVPEPGTWLLVGTGLAGLGFLRWRGRKQS